MNLNSGYSHSARASDGLVEHHFAGRPALSMEQCLEGGSSVTDFGCRHYAEPLVYNYDPSVDRYDRRVTTTLSRH